MASDMDLFRLKRQLDAMQTEIGRLTARDGEFAADAAIARQEAADLRSNVTHLEEVTGSLQERLAALEDDIQKERKYRQTGRLD